MITLIMLLRSQKKDNIKNNRDHLNETVVGQPIKSVAEIKLINAIEEFKNSHDRLKDMPNTCIPTQEPRNLTASSRDDEVT